MSFKNENLDVANNLGTAQLLKLRRSTNFTENFDSDFVDLFGFVYIGLNTKPDGINHKPIFTDQRVRRALAYATPCDEIIQIMLKGYGERQVSFSSPLKKYYNDDLYPIPLKIDSARILLDAAGWVDTDGDNIRDKEINGERIPLSFELMHFNIPTYIDMALILKEEMYKAGIDVRTKSMEFGQWVQNALGQDFDALIGSWSGNAGYNDPSQLWHTTSWANKGLNFTGFGDASSDSLIEAINMEMDEDKRDLMFKELQKRVYDEQPYVVLYSLKRKIAIHKRFTHTGMYVEKPAVHLGSMMLSTGSNKIDNAQ